MTIERMEREGYILVRVKHKMGRPPKPANQGMAAIFMSEVFMNESDEELLPIIERFLKNIKGKKGCKSPLVMVNAPRSKLRGILEKE